MNRRFHRVVLNAQGLRTVVQETARGSGKAGGGCTSVRGLASALLAVIASLTAVAAAAQIVADPNAPGRQRPTVLVAPNGVPVVNVQSPSAAGVSRNTYRQFDVGTQGVILNNSRTAVQSQLGGMVSGNPWLATGPARVILNEVKSSNPSYLNGAVEIAGQRAEFVLANPSGISVNGATFINSSAVTLTTGAPQFGATGNLENYLVRGGRIGVSGSGLDARDADSIAILSRAFELSGALHAKDLKVIAGANQVSADLSGITTITGSDGKPTYAIDVANLGGMYSNHIFLIVNELGVGARNAGVIQTSAGPVLITGEVGKLTLRADGILENSGLIQLASDGSINAGTVANTGTVRSAGNLQIATQGDLSNAAGTIEAKRIELASAAGDIDNRGGTIRQQTAQKPEDITLMHIAPAQTTLGELLVATYEQKLAPIFGYTNSDKSYAEILQGMGSTNITSMGHSRGTIVQTNAFNIAADNGYLNTQLSADGVGIAVSVSNYLAAVGRITSQPPETAPASITYMANDPVSVIAAGNSGNTFSSILEFFNVLRSSNSAHSCYGTGAIGCVTIANPIAGGPVPVNQQTSSIIHYEHGQLFPHQGSTK